MNKKFNKRQEKNSHRNFYADASASYVLTLDRETSTTNFLIDFLCSLARFCCQNSETLAIRIVLSVYFCIKCFFLIDSTRERCHPRNTKLSKNIMIVPPPLVGLLRNCFFFLYSCCRF
jgi:hypothetical protein